MMTHLFLGSSPVRPHVFRRKILLAVAALAALPLVPSPSAAVPSTWLSAVNGMWDDPARWSTAFFPNNGNGGVPYEVTIDAAGAPYTVTLDSNVTINAFTLNSADATVHQTTGTFRSLAPILLSAGTLHLNGGTLSNSTVNFAGSGTLLFGTSAGILDNSLINGNLTIANSTARARFQDGARFTGDLTLSSVNALVNFEYDATLQSGQTINLDASNAAIGVSRNLTTNSDSTFTIASGAVIRGRGAIQSSNFTAGTTNTFVNNGTVSADVSGAAMTVNPNIFVNNAAMQVLGGASMTISSGSLTNNGSITNSGGALTVNATNWANAAGATIAASGGTLTTGGTWSNAGTFSLNNATANFGGTFTTAALNLGNFSRTGGTVNLIGTLDNTGDTLTLTAATGSFRLLGGTITGGTVTRSGGADLVFTSNSGVIDGATIMGDLNMAESTARARLHNGGDFTGSATLSGTQAMLNYEYDATLGPGRTINLDAVQATLGVSRNPSTDSDSTLTISSGAAVRGRGSVTSGNFTAGTTNTIINNGTISADIAGQNLTVNPNVFTSNGYLNSVNGSRLTVSAPSFTNNGTVTIDGSTGTFSGNWSSPGHIRLSNAGTLNLDGTFSTGGINLNNITRTGATTINLSGNLNNAGSTLALTGTTGTWRLAAGTINGGTITRTGGADLTFTNTGGVLNGATIIGDISFTEGNARLELREGADFTGSATLSATGALLNYEYDATIGPGRTVNLEAVNATLGIARGGTPAADRTLTIAPGAHVRGRGSLSSGNLTAGTSNQIVNNGTISADIPSAGLTIAPNLFTNNGAIRAVNAATLGISAGSWSNGPTGSISIDGAAGTFSGTWSNSGTVLLANNATLALGGTMTTGGLGLNKFVRSGSTTVNLIGNLNNIGSTLALDGNSGSIRLAGGTLNGGSITRAGGADLIFTVNGVTLNGTSIVGDVAFAESNSRAELRNGADFTGSATLSGAGSILAYEYDAVIGSGRTINLEGSGAVLSASHNPTADTDSTLTIGNGAIVRGRGAVSSGHLQGGSLNTVVNAGLIQADTSGFQLLVNPNRLINNGTLAATNGGTLNLMAGSFSNGTGRFHATAGGRISIANLEGNLNNTSADGSSSLLNFDGVGYTINQPISITNNATLHLRGGWTKAADLNVGGRVVFNYPEPPEPEGTESPFELLRGEIVSGYASGAWNGPGINSAQAAATATHGVGYAEASTLFTSGTTHVWAGQVVDNTAVLVAYTRYGDADLNFTVNLADFNRLAANFGQSGKLWTDGDFTYDGVINLADFNRLAQNFGLAASGPEVSPDDWAALAAAVPEPTAAALVWLTACVAARRVRRGRPG